MKNEIDRLVPAQLVALARFCGVAMNILNARLYTLIGLILCAAGFGWALYDPSWMRVSAAIGFAVLGYWPLIRVELKANARQSTGGQDGEISQ